MATAAMEIPAIQVYDLVFIILLGSDQGVCLSRDLSLFKDEFSSWEQVLQAPTSRIAKVIKHGGLQNKKARYMKQALKKIAEDFGEKISAGSR